MKMMGRSWGAAFACFLVGLVWAVGMAKGDEMAVGPGATPAVTISSVAFAEPAA
jgi:hypothetical protein